VLCIHDFEEGLIWGRRDRFVWFLRADLAGIERSIWAETAGNVPRAEAIEKEGKGSAVGVHAQGQHRCRHCKDKLELRHLDSWHAEMVLSTSHAVAGLSGGRRAIGKASCDTSGTAHACCCGPMPPV
jgi:hypothetical protein